MQSVSFKNKAFLQGNTLLQRAVRNKKINKESTDRKKKEERLEVSRQFFLFLPHSSSTCFRVVFCRCRPDGAFPSRTGLTSSHEGINPHPLRQHQQREKKNTSRKKKKLIMWFRIWKSSFQCCFFLPSLNSLSFFFVKWNRCRPSRAPFLNGRHKRICCTSSLKEEKKKTNEIRLNFSVYKIHHFNFQQVLLKRRISEIDKPERLYAHPRHVSLPKETGWACICPGKDFSRPTNRRLISTALQR